MLGVYLILFLVFYRKANSKPKHSPDFMSNKLIYFIE